MIYQGPFSFKIFVKTKLIYLAFQKEDKETLKSPGRDGK